MVSLTSSMLLLAILIGFYTAILGLNSLGYRVSPT